MPAGSVLDPQIAGALGAALFAHSLHRKEQKTAEAGAGAAGAEATGSGATAAAAATPAGGAA